jgi:poly(A) polymerase Pap1
MVWAANVPLAKFKVRTMNVDLIFADFKTPKDKVSAQYFLSDENIHAYNHKSLECINSYRSMQQIHRTVEQVCSDSLQPRAAFEIFRRTTQVVKAFA